MPEVRIKLQFLNVTSMAGTLVSRGGSAVQNDISRRRREIAGTEFKDQIFNHDGRFVPPVFREGYVLAAVVLAVPVRRNGGRVRSPLNAFIRFKAETAALPATTPFCSVIVVPLAVFCTEI